MSEEKGKPSWREPYCIHSYSTVADYGKYKVKQCIKCGRLASPLENQCQGQLSFDFKEV